MLQSILNPSDLAFYDNAYRVVIGYYSNIDYIVIASDEQSALDTVIDHLNENKGNHPGYFLSELDQAEIENDPDGYLDQYVYGGNYCQYLSFTNDELHIKLIGKTNSLTLYTEIKG